MVGKYQVLARHSLGTTGSTGHRSEVILKLNMATIVSLRGSVIVRCNVEMKSLENLFLPQIQTTLSGSFLYFFLFQHVFLTNIWTVTKSINSICWSEITNFPFRLQRLCRICMVCLSVSHKHVPFSLSLSLHRNKNTNKRE